MGVPAEAAAAAMHAGHAIKISTGDCSWQCQAAAMVVQDREVLRVTVNNANNGGLLSVLDGLPAFVPFSLVPKAPNERLTVEVCLHTRPAVPAVPTLQGSKHNLWLFQAGWW